MKAYIAPQIQILSLQTEGVVATSFDKGDKDVDLDDKSKHADSHKSGIWNNMNE